MTVRYRIAISLLPLEKLHFLLLEANLRRDHAQKHQRTAGVTANAKILAEKQRAADRGEHCLKAEDDRGVGRIRVLLADDLKRERDPNGEEASVEHRKDRRADRRDRDVLEKHRRSEAQGRAGDELQKRQKDRVEFFRVVIDDKNMDGPEAGTDDLKKIAEADREVLSDADQIETDRRDRDADPGAPPRTLPQEEPENRYEHDVHARDEGGFACRCIEHADLLKRDAREKDKSDDDARNDRGS